MTTLGGRKRLIAALTATLLLTTTMAACGGGESDDEAATGVAGAGAEPEAGRWKTWVLASGSELTVPPPPEAGSAKAKADLAEVKRLAATRSPEAQEAVKRWSGPVPTQPWTNAAFDFVSKQAKNPPLSTRNYALLHVAMYDATVSAYHWKYQYRVDPPKDVETLTAAGPDPSYPSEHAAMAGAASRVLAYLYPKEAGLRLDEMAEEAGDSRVLAGVNTPSDVAAGLDLGRAVADKVIAYAKTDGAGTPWSGKRPPGIGRGPAFWEPRPGSVAPPIDPEAGKWKAWVMTSNNQFRPGPPPAYGSPEFLAAAKEVVEVRKNLTPEQEQLARFYEGDTGTKLPGGITLDVNAADVLKAASGDLEGQPLTEPRAVRALAMITVALADAGISAWDAKYTYWNPRPHNAVRDLGLDPNWNPLLVNTPLFPAYPSGSAGYAGAAEAVMGYLFPADKAKFKKRAEEQAESRLLGGIHWRYDSVSIEAGRKIGGLVAERAKRDGADKS